MWRCPQCETYNEDNSNFCAVCGFRKPKDEEPEVVSAPAEPAEPAQVEYFYTEETYDGVEDIPAADDLTADTPAAPEYDPAPAEPEYAADEPGEEKTDIGSGILAIVLGLALAAAMIYLFMSGAAMAENDHHADHISCVENVVSRT